MKHTFAKPAVTCTGLFLTLLLLAITTVDANATTMICIAQKLLTHFSVRNEAIMGKFICPSFHRPVLINKMRDSIESSTVTTEKVTEEYSTRNFFFLNIFSQLLVKNKKLGKNNIDRCEKKEKKRKKRNPTTHAASLYKKKGSTASSTVTDSSIMDKPPLGTCTKIALMMTSLILMVLFVNLMEYSNSFNGPILKSYDTFVAVDKKHLTIAATDASITEIYGTDVSIKIYMFITASITAVLLFCVGNEFTSHAKTELQEESNRGQRYSKSHRVWSINLVLACCLIGTTEGSFFTKESGQCSKFTSAHAEACWNEYPFDETVCDIAMKSCWDASDLDAYYCSDFASCSTQCGSALTNDFQVNDAGDCKKGSAAVGWTDTIPDVVTTSSTTSPPGCYLKPSNVPGQRLLLLPSTSTGPCTSDRQCLCWTGSTCSNTEGTVVNPTDCMCGEKICDDDDGRYCQVLDPPECTTGVCKFTSAQAEACWTAYPYDETICDIAMKPCWDLSDEYTYSCSDFASCSTQCGRTQSICSKTAVCAITDGTAANTQDCVCGMTQCDASTGHYCSSSINTCYKTPCATLFLSASGSTTQSSRLGTYTWIGSNSDGKPAYKSGTNYLYWVNENEKWYISEVLGSSTDTSLYWSSSEVTPDLSSASPTEIKAWNGAAYQDENIIITCACPMSNGLSINTKACQCGSSSCDSEKGLYCLASSNQCAQLPLCANIDGSVANSGDCRCGTSACYASTDGRYCNSAESKCGGNCFTGSTFDLNIFVSESRTSKLSPGCNWSTVGTDWCVDIEADRLKVGAHTLTRLNCSFTSAMTIAAGTALKLSGDPSVPTVLSGMGKTHFFDVYGQLTFENLIFENGKTQLDGGAFFVSSFGSRLHMKQSVVCYCETVGFGGAVRVENRGILVMEDSTLESNKADKRGGAVSAVSGAKIILIVGTTSYVQGNTAANYGGGFELDGEGTHLDVSGKDTKLVVRENTAVRGGGLMVWFTAAITVSDGAQMNVTKNTAERTGGFHVENARFDVFGKDTKLFMVENIANIDAGGAWLISSAVFSISSGAAVLCERNSAAEYGGCLYVQTESELQVKGADTKFLVHDNTAVYGGGGLTFVLQSSGIISDSAVVKIARNSAEEGGGIDADESSIKVSGSGTKLIVEQNIATYISGGGGGIHGEKGASFTIDTSAALEVRNNIAEKHAGGILLKDQNTFLNVIDKSSQAVFIGNTAKTGSGGGVGLFTGASLGLFGPSIFRRNSAPNGNGGGIGYVSDSEEDDGGSSCVSLDLRIKSTNPTGSDIEVYTTPNTAISSKDWGALINSDGTSAGDKITKWCIPCGSYKLTVSQIYSGRSLGAGSFVKLSLSARPSIVLGESTKNAAYHNSKSTFSLACSHQGVAATSAIFENNHAGKLGGALGMLPNRKNGIFDITASSFINNTAGLGGAAYASGSNSGLKLTGGCTMEKNSAKSKGGSIALEDGAGLRIEDMIATANQAESDGGFLYAQFASPILLQNVSILKSSSTHGNGGALAVTASQIALEKVQIHDCNTKVGDGGAIFLDGQAEAHLLRSDLSNNNAAAAGGHIKLAASTLIAHDQDSLLIWPASKPIFPGAIMLRSKRIEILNPPESSRRYSGVNPSWGDEYMASMLDSGGAWSCPDQGEDLSKCWIEIDLGGIYTINGVVTQGTNSILDHYDWVTAFEVLFGTTFSDLTSIGNFTGNSDSDSRLYSFFTQVQARYVRIVPKAYSGGYASFRAAVLLDSNDKTSFTRGISTTESGAAISCLASSSSAEKPIQIYDTKPTSGSCYQYQKDTVSNILQHACFSKGIYLGRGTIVSDSIASGNGGAIDAVSCSIVLEQVTLKGNKAHGIGNNGGAIHLGTASKLVVDTSTTFLGNKADGSGGAIACSDCGEMTLSETTTFINNTAQIPLPSCPRSINSYFISESGPRGAACSCDEGSYSQVVSNSVTCVKCRAKSSSEKGSTSEDACKCNEGTYLSTSLEGTKECMICPINSVILDDTGPVENACACRENYYAEITGNTMTCVKCRAKSSSEKGSTSEDTCKCNEGTYVRTSLEGTKECMICPINSVIVDDTGPVENACACRENYYADITETTMTCIKCPDDKSASPGSTKCQCKKGTHYLSDPATGTCSSCPPEADCSYKSDALLTEIVPKPGYWRSDPNSTKFADCATMFSGSADGRLMAEKRCCPIPTDSNTSICMQHLLPNTKYTHRRQCREVDAGSEGIVDSKAEAYAGPMCQTCLNEEYSFIGGVCSKCLGGSSVGNVIHLLAPFFAVLFLVFTVLFLKADKKEEKDDDHDDKKKKKTCCGRSKKKKKKKEKKKTHEENKKTHEKAMEDHKGKDAASRLLDDQTLLGRMQGSGSSESASTTASAADSSRGDGQVIVDRVKVVYGWLQCFTAITFTFDVAWPANLKGFSLSLNFINLDLGNIMAGSSCSFAISSLEKFYVHMSLPAVLLVVLLLARIPAKFLRKSKTQQAKQKAVMMKLITALALIMYPGICVRLFSTLKCIQVPGLASDVHSGIVMASDYAVQCYVDEHATAVLVAIICGITWVFGIPAAVAVALKCNRTYLHTVGKEDDEEHLAKHKDVVDEFGTLFLQYEPKYYWWEVTVIFKKSKYFWTENSCAFDCVFGCY